MKRKFHELIILISKMNELYPHIISLQVMDSILSSILQFINVLFLGVEVNLLFTREKNKEVIIYTTMFFIGLIIIISILSKVLANYAEKQGRLINLRAKTNMSKHLVEVDFETFEDGKFRELYNDVKSGLEFVGGFQTFIKSVISNTVNFFTTLLISGSILITVIIAPGRMAATKNLEVLFLVAGLISVPLITSYFCGKKFGKIMNNFFAFNIQFNQKLNYYFEQAFKDVGVKKLLWMFDPTHKFFNKAKKEILKDVEIDRDLQVKATSVASFSSIIINVIIGIIYIIIGMVILEKNLGVGTIVACVGTLELLIYDLSDLLNSLGNSKSSLNVIREYFEFMNKGIKENKENQKLNFDKNNFEIVFHNVSYQYPGRKDWALKNISLSLKSGQKIAIVGKNGGGKTTLAKLLLRLILPTSGFITLNGIDIQKFNLNEYQKLFSSVPQNTFLFADSISNNITLGVDKDEDRIKDSLKKVKLDKKINSLNDGIDTPLTTQLNKKGISLSGGETQEIGISRAIYRNSEVYVLDEPTAALDPIKEADMFNHINEIINDHTALFISHRMSLTNRSDYIYVLDKGRVVEKGTHDTLLSNKSLYYKLYKTQQDYFEKLA